ncbi:MAG: MBL fold metallo-hydrolase [Pyrinomonadaceae bacterium]
MKIQLLPSTFDSSGYATPEQRLTCYLIDDCVALDAGSIALALNDSQRETVRDVIITHPHMDHMATLPIYIDDLFGILKEPIRVHATEEIIALLERDVFNWTVYPRFTELSNEHGPVMQYVPFRVGEEFQVKHLRLIAVPVNHIVPTVGLIVSDGKATVAFTSDTAATEEFWHTANRTPHIDALFIEASFPNAMADLADVSGHLTPAALGRELCKLSHNHLDVLAVHLKPTYRETIVREIEELALPNLRVMQPGHNYEW